MKIINSHIARDLFSEEIVDQVNNYLNNIEVYPEDICIAVQKCTCELELLRVIDAGPDWTVYPISTFLRQNENKDGIEVDIDATLDLADKYYFVR